MNSIKNAALGLALVLGSTAGIAAECVSPAAPELPEGATSSMEQMLSGQKAVKEFQAANLSYMSCLEPQIEAARSAVEAGTEDAEAALQQLEGSYNAAVSQEEEVAGQFNTEIREYKAANPA